MTGAPIVAMDPSERASRGPAGRADVPRLTAELFSIPIDAGRYLIYAPLRRAAFVGNGATVNLIAGLREGRHDTARDPGGVLAEFLRRLEIVDAPDEERLPVTNFNGDPEPTSVTLFLTTACNLRCTYCYAKAGDTPQRFMSLETARRGIDFVCANAASKGTGQIEVNYHGGGEPSVHWKVLTESFRHAKERAAALDLELESSAATNGVLSDAQIDWIVANLHGVSLSCDGLPAAHDRHRPLISGKGSSPLVYHTLRRFDEAGFPYGLRVTVTADQIPFMADGVEYLCANFGAERIQVEPAYQLGRWAGAPTAETQGFIDAFRAARARAARFGRQIDFSAARFGTLTNHFCGVTQDTFALSPDGNVSACYEVFSEENRFAEVFFYGRPDEGKGGYRFDLEKLEELRGQTVESREFCRGCFCRWSCAGDCYHKSLSTSSDGRFAGSDRCHITRELTRDQILEAIARSGGLFWHEPPEEE